VLQVDSMAFGGSENHLEQEKIIRRANIGVFVESG
jgi:hypothetical protein